MVSQLFGEWLTGGSSLSKETTPARVGRVGQKGLDLVLVITKSKLTASGGLGRRNGWVGTYFKRWRNDCFNMG